MANKSGLLILEPSTELFFPGPALRSSRTILKLKNASSNKIAFKIKTTAPSFYGVRPNAGVVPKRSTVEVEIGRQPITSEQSRMLKHKFMVQSMVVEDDVENAAALWQNLDPSKLCIVKLRCIFEGELLTDGRSKEKAFERSPPDSINLEISSHKINPIPVENFNSGSDPKEDTTGKYRESMESIRRLLDYNNGKKRSDEHVPMPLPVIDAQTSMAGGAAKATISPKISPFKLSPSPQKSLVLSVQKLTSPQRSCDLMPAQIKSQMQSPTEPLPEYDDILSHLQFATIKAEIKQLRIENKNLRKDNEVLKEDIQQRYRTHSPVRGEFRIAHTELIQQQQQRQVPVCYVIASMSFALLCILIGKFLL